MGDVTKEGGGVGTYDSFARDVTAAHSRGMGGLELENNLNNNNNNNSNNNDYSKGGHDSGNNENIHSDDVSSALRSDNSGRSRSSVTIHCDLDDPDLTSNRENPDDDDDDVNEDERRKRHGKKKKKMKKKEDNNGDDEDEEEDDDDDEGMKPHNRSRDSIESQRTLIEAEDFASFLAQEDEEDLKDVDDILDDFGVRVRESEDFDISALMRKRENPYVLDFTSADNSVVGEDNVGDEGEEGGSRYYHRSDDTLSDEYDDDDNNEKSVIRTGLYGILNRSKGELRGDIDNDDDGDGGGGNLKAGGRGKRRDRPTSDELGTFQKTSSWLKATEEYHHQQKQQQQHHHHQQKDKNNKNLSKQPPRLPSSDDDDDDDDESEFSSRNLREEINNNINKMSFMLMSSSSSSLPSMTSYPDYTPHHPHHPPPPPPSNSSSTPALSKYFSASSSSKSHHHTLINPLPSKPHAPQTHTQSSNTTTTSSTHAPTPVPKNKTFGHHHHHHHPPPPNSTSRSLDLSETPSSSLQQRLQQQHQHHHHHQQQQQQQQSYSSPSSNLSATLSPRYSSTHISQIQQQQQQQQHEQHGHHYDNPTTPTSNHPLSPRLQAYQFETPFRASTPTNRHSSSMENLANFGDSPYASSNDVTAANSNHAGFEVYGYYHHHHHSEAPTGGGYPLQRRNSAPNLVEGGSPSAGMTPSICRNCQFAKDDYLFKIRLLQTQLEKTEKDLKKKEKQWNSDMSDLKKETERQQKLIGQSLTLGPEARIETTMQHEITRLTSENLDLRETIDHQTDQSRKLKKMLKVYAKKLKDGEAAEIAAELENDETAGNGDTGIASVIHRERAYMGMLEYKKEDEGALVKNLILDLKPKIASGFLPGLPAYILFMCVRHTDYVNDDDKVKTLLTSTINGIKKVVKRHSDDLERITLWLANTCRLLHTLKQYSGEKQFQSENTSKQNEQCLRNFDLSEYRQVFSDLAVWNYQALMKLMEELIQPNIVPAILEHEAIAGLTASKPSGLRGRSSSNAREMDEDDKSHHSLDSLMRTLNSYMRIVKQHAVDPELVKQIFRQLFYFMSAGALNNLLLRKDMCNWSKGMQIRYNLSHLEQWLRDNCLHEFGAQAALEPIIQASQLLQARKTDSDVDSVCDMCSKLTTAQIVKILNIYTPVDEFEERVPVAFIRKIQAKLKSRTSNDPSSSSSSSSSSSLLLDTKYSFPVTFPFNPSSIAMETVSVPDQAHLGFLVRH